MKIELTTEQLEQQEVFRVFVDKEVVPCADQFDKEERLPSELIGKIAENGFLAATIPESNGGKGMDMVTHGLLCEEFGSGSASVLSLFTVHGMLAQAILQWGSPEQRSHLLPQLASGKKIGAFGLTEPDIGSDAKSVQTTAKLDGASYVLNGTKKWISCGQIADIFLIIAQCEGKPTAFLVEKDCPGLTIKPITGLLGFKAAMLAELSIE